MESKFNNIISDIINKKLSGNNSFITIDEYNIRIEQLKNSKFVLKTPGE
jgi:predicted PilT family ATPase